MLGWDEGDFPHNSCWECCDLILESECWRHRDVLAGQGLHRTKEFPAPHPTSEGGQGVKRRYSQNR